MTLTNVKPVVTVEQQRYADAVDSALDIIFYYEDDEYESLAEESVIDDLTDNFGYSISESQEIFISATAIHEYRTLSGFYN